MMVFLLSPWKELCRATGRGYAHPCSLSVSWGPGLCLCTSVLVAKPRQQS